jgi:hypothetical protein
MTHLAMAFAIAHPGVTSAIMDQHKSLLSVASLRPRRLSGVRFCGFAGVLRVRPVQPPSATPLTVAEPVAASTDRSSRGATIDEGTKERWNLSIEVGVTVRTSALRAQPELVVGESLGEGGP